MHNVYDLIIAYEPEAVYKYPQYDFCFVKVEMCWIRKKVENMPFFLQSPTYKRTPNPKENWSHNTSSWAYSCIPSLYKHTEL